MARSNNDNIADEFDAAFRKELDMRLSILSPEGRDFVPIGEFNTLDYFLIVVFGVVVPIATMVWGWR
jgi:hypothetical protein